MRASPAGFAGRIFCPLVILVFALSLPTETLAKAKQAKEHKFKNLPGVSPTPESTWYLAEELNFFTGSVLANTTLDYGYANGWNVGLSLLNVGLYEQTSTALWNPDVLLNVEKSTPLTPGWTLLLGTQNGTAIWDSRRSSGVESYSYLDNQFSFIKAGIQLHLGGYIASPMMAGTGDRVGYLLGVRLPLMGDRLALSLDYLSGNNALGAGSIQMLWRASRHWRFDVGAQSPAIGSPNDYGALLGVTWQP